MPDMLAIAQGLNALKATTDILKTMVGLRDSAQIIEKTVELNSKIADAQIALSNALAEQATLTQTIRDLEKKVADFEKWDTEKEHYELKDLGFTSFAYMLKPEARGSEPPHFVCTNCYNQRRISIIQYGTPRTGGRSGYYCPACKCELRPGEAFANGHIRWLD